MRKTRISIVLAFLSTSVCSAPVVAQTPPPPPAPATAPALPPVSADPQITTATFGDWVLRCVKPDLKTAKSCEIVQTLQVQNQGTIAQLAFGRLNPKDPLRLTVVVPPNISLPSTLRVGIDEKDPQSVEVSWRRCLPGGCYADGEAKDDTLRRWRAQPERGQLQVLTGTGQPVIIPFSFRGLAQALDALAKS